MEANDSYSLASINYSTVGSVSVIYFTYQSPCAATLS